jgi:hypothetical protein
MEKKKYLITNLVYSPQPGNDLYLRIFTERHLRSVLDDTNLQAAISGYNVDITYKIYCDPETEKKLLNHPNVKRLQAIVAVKFQTFEWANNNDDRFAARYPLLYQAFNDSVKYALDNQFDFVTAWVADLVVARDFFPRILKRVALQDHDAVFVLPLRSAFESTAQAFAQVNRALHDHDLFRLGFAHLHPLWVACHWGSPTFTRMPYSLLWRSNRGLMARSYSLTPIIFKPKVEILNSSGGIDLDVPGMFENPYWCEDWTDAPVIGVEPMFCHYPTFQSEKCSVGLVKRWAYRGERPPIYKTQRPYLKKRLYYPSKSAAKISWWTKFKSDLIAWRLR